MEDILAALLAMALLPAVIYFFAWLYVLLPSRMANARRRNPTIWVLIAVVGGPPLAILLLIALGEAPHQSARRRG